MCGIVGWVGPGARGHADRVRGAREAMRHRGPDDAGLYLDDAACLGACRLAILDLSPAGHMPMESADGRYTIVFNGAIYNFVELRAELAREVEFRSTGDTEVILNGFRVWGWPALLDRLDGMFAFAIWDARERTLFAARDRMGEKPFFFARDGGSLAFASTLTSLIQLRDAVPRVDPRALDAFLTYQAVPAPLAIFDGCAQLPAAHALRFDATRGDLTVFRYWDVAFAPKRRVSVDEAVESIDALARRAVRQRLRSDVPTGTLLSGGVDSSLITALASEEQPGGIDAVTMGFEEADGDERPYARLVAQRYGARLHEEIIKPSVVADLPAIIAQYGQPLADVSIVPNYYLARAARRVMKVALVGDGADEAFGGYARPMIERVAPRYRALLPHVVRQAIAAMIGEPQGTRSTGALRRRLSLLAVAGQSSARDAFVYDRGFRAMRARTYAPSLLAATGDWHPDSLYHEAWDRAVGVDDVDRALYGDLTTYLPDQLLAKADVSAMAHGLEARSPFLAREIIEYAATLPTELRLRHFQTKFLLKRVAEKYVPYEAIHRPKRGFVMPAALWLRRDLAPYLRAALDTPQFLDRGWLRADAVRTLIRQHSAGTHDWSNQLWTLLVLEIWARVELDRTLGAGDTLDQIVRESGRKQLTPSADQRVPVSTLQIGMEWFSERPGGLNRVYARLLRELDRIDVYCDGLVAGSPAVLQESGGLARSFAAVRDRLWSRLWKLRRAAMPWLEANPRDGVVVSHFALHALPLLDCLGSRPFVVHFHGPWGQESRLEGGSRLGALVKTIVERRIYQRADALIVLSRAFGDILASRFGVSRDRIHVVPGGVDHARFAAAPSRDECRAMLDWPADRPIVLCVRRLVKRVGVDVLVSAVAELRERVPNVLVLIAGTGKHREQLQQQIDALGVGTHVRLVGFLADEQLPVAYRAADLSVVPSRALEGFGLVCVESLAAGTPVIVTPVGGLPESVSDLSPNLVTASCSAHDIADALAGALLGERALPTAQQCSEFARTRYDWSVVASQVRAVYASVIP